jgi:hypothetical protein
MIRRQTSYNLRLLAKPLVRSTSVGNVLPPDSPPELALPGTCLAKLIDRSPGKPQTGPNDCTDGRWFRRVDARWLWLNCAGLPRNTAI